MKYCLFDGGDVVGPFSAQELLRRPGFGAHSLVCPEEHSDEEAFWKEARLYEEFGFAPPDLPPQPPVQEPAASEFLEEMDQAVQELSSFTVQEKEMPSAPSAAQEKEPLPPQSPIIPAVSPQPIPAKAETEKNPAQEEKPKISTVLMQASEEMKRLRVARAAASEGERQQKAAAKTTPHVPDSGKEEDKQPLPASEVPNEKKAEPKEELGPAPVRPSAETEVVERTVGQMSPIEEYFNTVKSGDLGRILGIPDPKENSDMNLARALESQFEKTDPGTGKPMDDDPFDEFTPKEKTSDAGQELLNELLPPDADKKTQENLSHHSLPDLQNAESLPLAGQPHRTAEAEEPESNGADFEAVQEMVVPVQDDDDPNDKTVKTILEGQLKVDTLRQEIPEPIKEVPPEEKEPKHSHAAELVREHEQHAAEKHTSGKLKFVFLGLGVVVLLTGAYLNWAHRASSSSAPAADGKEVFTEAAPAVSEEADALPDARAALHIQTPQVAPSQQTDPLELAKEIVQNYRLDKGRGTVEEYLNKLYRKQLQEGYAAMWSAEPLHRDSYVVKFRLAKTRKEPIVYIFQADTAKKKLTGALNNITLDLVGKIS